MTEDERGYKAVRYSELQLMLLQAVRELRAEKDGQIAGLKAENAALKAELKSVEERIAALEAALGKDAAARH